MTGSFTGFIETIDALRQVYEQPSKGATAKEISRLDENCQRFIALSPFMCMGTMNVNGCADVSPRGGEPGFVHVIGPNLIAFPDRPGNNRLDSLINIVGNPAVGLLFFVPGFEDMLRVNGTGKISIDHALRKRFEFNSRLPTSVVLVTVSETQTHCAKAIKRARLWDPSSFADRRSFPSLGQILRDHLGTKTPVAIIDDMAEKDARERLY